jgi:hypothetical protein
MNHTATTRGPASSLPMWIQLRDALRLIRPVSLDDWGLKQRRFRHLAISIHELHPWPALADFLLSLGLTPQQTPLVFTLPNVAFDYGHAVILSVELRGCPDGSLPL